MPFLRWTEEEARYMVAARHAPEVGIRSRPLFKLRPPAVTLRPFPPPSAFVLPQERVLVWLLLWAAWGAVSGLGLGWNSDPFRVAIPAACGAAIGLAGG